MSNYTGGVNERRKRTLQRLQKQVEAGVRPVSNKNKKGLSPFDLTRGRKEGIKLLDEDRKRIDQEIATLKDRIK